MKIKFTTKELEPCGIGSKGDCSEASVNNVQFLSDEKLHMLALALLLPKSEEGTLSYAVKTELMWRM